MARAPITFPASRASRDQDPLEREQLEIDAAVELVLSGVATRVLVANLSRPEATAARAAAAASGLPVRVRLIRGAGSERTICVERLEGLSGRAP